MRLLMYQFNRCFEKIVWKDSLKRCFEKVFWKGWSSKIQKPLVTSILWLAFQNSKTIGYQYIVTDISEFKNHWLPVFCDWPMVVSCRDAIASKNIFRTRSHKKCRRRSKRKDSLRITLMSVVVISVFLMIEIPLMIITMLHAMSTKVRRKIICTAVITLYIICSEVYIGCS